MGPDRYAEIRDSEGIDGVGNGAVIFVGNEAVMIMFIARSLMESRIVRIYDEAKRDQTSLHSRVHVNAYRRSIQGLVKIGIVSGVCPPLGWTR